MLAETIERLRHLIEWIYSQRIAQRAPRSWDEHRQIVDAIASGDAVTAERVARAHIALARAAYVEQLSAARRRCGQNPRTRAAVDADDGCRSRTTTGRCTGT